MASPAVILPHLSPRPSAERVPTVSQQQKRHRSKRPSFLLGNKHKQAAKPVEPTLEEDTLDDATLDSAIATAAAQQQGPNLRLLPETDEAPSDVPAKLDRYVELPQDPQRRLEALHSVKQNKLRYEWDYIMEHQRGFRFLSTPLFSQAGLLPTDPPPFTTIGKDRVPCSLDDFQLPSPEWQWAGEGWCVDMRGDGEVQEDGFEYNWWFRHPGWRPTIGLLSSGAYVRRRRWMRLRYLTPPEPVSEKPSQPRSPARKSGELRGWEKLRATMRSTDVDRERVDMVKAWLDDGGSNNEDVLREHWADALELFVYPSSRESLRSMVRSMDWKTLPAGDEEIFWKEEKG